MNAEVPTSKVDYKLVVPKKTKITIGGQRGAIQKQTFNIGVDIYKQSVADVKALLQNIIIDQTQEQLSINNPANLLRTDEQTKPIYEVRRKIQVWYGSFVSKAAMQEIEFRVAGMLNLLNQQGSIAVPNGSGPWMRAGYSGSFRYGFRAGSREYDEKNSKISLHPDHQRSRGEWRTRNPVANINDWAWFYISFSNKGEKAKKINGPQEMIITEGDRLVFRPKTRVASFYTSFQLYWLRRGGWNPGEAFKEISKNKLGPMGELSKVLKRKPLLKPFKISTKWYHADNQNYWKVGVPSVSLLVAGNKVK